MTVRHPARLAAVLALAALAAACSSMTEKQKPGPLNGQGRSTTREADEAERQAKDPNRPADVSNARDRSTDPAPPRTLPIPSSGTNPSRPAPQGALPDPYANPR